MEAAFRNPEALALVPVAVVVAFLVIALARRSFTSLSSYLRILLFALLALVITRPCIETREQTSRAVVLVDVSASMDPEVANRLLDGLRRLDGIDLSVVPFARHQGVTLPFEGSYQRFLSLSSRLGPGDTDLGGALESAEVPPSSRVILLSDGYSTREMNDTIIARARDKRLTVYPLTPRENSKGAPIFGISQLHVPLMAPTETGVPIRVSIRNTTDVSRFGILEVAHDDKTVFHKMVSIPAGSEEVFGADSDPSKEGVHRVTARFSPREGEFSPSTAVTFLSGEVGKKVLLVSGREEDGRYLRDALQGKAYRVETKWSSVGDLSKYAAVILNDVPAATLGQTVLSDLRRYVESGQGGLVMTGGAKSFGLGGYIGTPIEPILPVTLLPPRTTQKRLNAAVQLVIDKSRSMAENERLDYAKEAAREVVRSLKDEDYIGVIGYDATPFVVVRIDQVGSVRESAIDRVGRLFPAGRTNLLPAMDEARRGFERVRAGRKHMIVLTDGKLPDAGPYYLELVRQMRLEGITLSTVLVGGETEEALLHEMARTGGGAYYETADPRSLPRIFLSDIKVNAGERTMRENEDYLVRRGPDPLVTTALQSFPTLKGYVETEPRGDAQTELVAAGREGSAPLLASRQVAKGRVVAFTSDASGRWSGSWVRWPKFQQFWSEVVDSVRPKESPLPELLRFDLRPIVEGGGLLLDLAVYGESQNVTGELTMPSGAKRQVTFTPRLPGHYEGLVGDPIAGEYQLQLYSGKNKLTPVAFSLAGDLLGERKGLGYHTSFLEALAQATGGKVNPTPEEIRVPTGEVVDRIELSPLIFGLIALLFLAEILVVELPGLRRIAAPQSPRSPGLRPTT